MSSQNRSIELEGTLWFRKSENRFLGADRIVLLEQIDALGSINKAAKNIGISYKTAWQLINTINNLSEKAIVERTTGGKDGGGTRLTPEGRKILRQYRLVQEEHRKFLENLEERLGRPERLYQFLKRISVKVSARNVFSGTIAKITRETVNAEIILSLKGNIRITAIVTNNAIGKLGLEEGMTAYAIIKSSSVIIGKEIDVSKISTRNVIFGSVDKIIDGPVNVEIDLDIGGSNIITSIITRESSKNLALKEGSKACAMFKASSVIIGVH
jgi:molybdate transport system regulatory protein